MEVKGVIPKLTRLIFSSTRTAAAWITEKFVSLCEALVRAFVWCVILVAAAAVLIDGSTRLQSRAMMVAGVVIGFIGFMYLAFVSSLFRMGIEALASVSSLVKREVERLSNIMFVGVLVIFYLCLDRAYQHPFVLVGFLATLAVIFWATILPGEGPLRVFFKSRFQWIALAWAIVLTVVAVMPGAITNRITSGYSLEKVTGTIATEISFSVDQQDRIIDLTTNQPMEFFERVSAEGEAPKARIGWTRDSQGNYHLYKWFDGQANWTPMGEAIQIVTTAKIQDIIIETKRTAETKAAEEKRVGDEQKAAADAEAAKLQTEAARLQAEEEKRQKAQQAAEETARQQREQEAQAVQQRAEAERAAQEAAQEEQLRLARQPVSVASTIMGPSDQSQDIVITRPSTQFTYQKTSFEPEQSVVTFDITSVKPTASDKNKYDVTLQPEMLISNGQKYDISRRAEPVQLTVKKDNSNSIRNIIGGTLAGVAVGAIMGGKKGAVTGAVIGATAGTIYTVASHGQKFQLVAGDPMPPILIRPIVP